VVVCLITCHLEAAPLFRIPASAGRTSGLKLESQVMVDKVIAIPRNKIARRAGALSAVALKEVEQALRLWLELCRLAILRETIQAIWRGPFNCGVD
jgi:mRNA interferase MazF